MLTLLVPLLVEVATKNRAVRELQPAGKPVAGNTKAFTFPALQLSIIDGVLGCPLPGRHIGELSSINAAIDAGATTPQGGKQRDCRNCGPPPGHDA